MRVGGYQFLTGAGLDGVDLEQEDEDAHEVRHVAGEPEGVHLAGRSGSPARIPRVYGPRCGAARSGLPSPSGGLWNLRV